MSQIDGDALGRTRSERDRSLAVACRDHNEGTPIVRDRRLDGRVHRLGVAVSVSAIMTVEQVHCVRCGGDSRVGRPACTACGWPFTLEAWSDFERPPYRITLDTCCINVRRQNQDLNVIELWAQHRKVVLQRSEAMLLEIRGRARVSKAAAMAPHPGLFILGSSMLGGPDVLGGPDMGPELESILFPTSATLTLNQQQDVEHLRTHIQTGGDVFVTLNPNDFITRGRQERFRSVGIWVMSPAELVRLLRSTFGWR